GRSAYSTPGFQTRASLPRDRTPMPDETNHPIIEIKQRETGKVLHILSPESLRFADPHRIMLRPDFDLRGADLKQADLRNAVLRRVNLEGADLQGADLQNASLGSAN